MRHYPSGIGLGYTSERLQACTNLYTSGEVWYVDSVTGDDTNGIGTNPEAPYATLNKAYTSAAAGDIIALFATHDETLTSTISVSKSLTIVGLGTDSSGYPAASLTNNVSGAAMITVAAQVEIRNVRFKENGASATTAPLVLATTTSNGSRILGCRFEVGDNNPTTGLYSGLYLLVTSDVLIEDCVFKSVGTDPTAAPAPVLSTGTSVQTRMVVRRCTLDAGTTGFASSGSGAAAYLNATHVNLVLEDLTLIGGDVLVGASSSGRFNVLSSIGSAYVSW